MLKFFGLGAQSSISDLNAAYSHYLRKYLPEYNRGREDWALSMTKKLKEAYGVALDHLISAAERRSAPVIAAGAEIDETPAGSEQRPRRDPDSGPESFSANARPGRRFVSSVFGEQKPSDESSTATRFLLFDAFFEAVDEALEGIFLYYQYGLENVHLRHEGVRSYRYRTAVRKVSGAARKLESLPTERLSGQDQENLVLFTEFANTFLQNMRIEKTQSPASSSSDGKAYRHFSRASAMLDRAIRDAFFEELRERGSSSPSRDNMELCTREFMVVLTEHLTSTWVTETAIKVYLLDIFTKLLRRSSPEGR